MSRVNFKKMILKQGELACAVVKTLQALDASICIQDGEGNAILGVARSAPYYPVKAGDEVIGLVQGDALGAPLAFLLTELVGNETAKKSLANEVLGLYREINLLYKLSEKLATSLDLTTVAHIGLHEAHTLIKGTHGAVVLARESNPQLELVAALGDSAQTQVQLDGIEKILQSVIASGKADVNNYVRLDPRYTNRGVPVSALICAPLRAKDQTIGAMALMSDAIITYTAAELKLLNTLASLVGPAIENALIHEKTLREAKERMENLQRQVEQLKIELDQALLAKEVSRITDSDYFQNLSQRARKLRRPPGGEPGQSSGSTPGA